MKPAVEEYLNIKRLPAELRSAHGLSLSEDNLRAIQQEAARLNDGLFLAGCARVSEIIIWLRKHPEFSRPRKPKYGRAAMAA
jgi:hypothetical protein